jgi:hypothetical protein
LRFIDIRISTDIGAGAIDVVGARYAGVIVLVADHSPAGLRDDFCGGRRLVGRTVGFERFPMAAPPRTLATIHTTTGTWR